MSVCRGGYAVVLGLAAALVLSPAGQAGGCPPAAAVSYSYSYAPAAVSYAPVSYAPVVKTVIKREYVPYAVKVPVSPDYYSSSQDYYRDKLLTDAMAGKVTEALQLQQRLQGLEQQLQQSQHLLQQRQSADQEYQEYQRWKYERQQQQPPPQRMPPAHNGQGGYNGYGPGAGSGQQQSQGRSDVPEGLQQVLANSCLRCHGPTAPQQGGGLDLRDPGSVPWETRLLCHSEVCNGSMPRGGRVLSPEETALFYEWAQAGRLARR